MYSKNNFWNLLLLEAQQQINLDALAVILASSTLQHKSKMKVLSVQLQKFSHVLIWNK